MCFYTQDLSPGVKRNLDFVDGYLGREFAAERRESEELEAIRELYLQQKKMFDTGTRRVENRIVCISKPFIRPIVRGKAKTPVKFGAKYDVSVDGKEHARLERISFDAYNKCSVLPDAVERFKKRTGRYPSRVLVESIYARKPTGTSTGSVGSPCRGGAPAGRPPTGPRRMQGKKRRTTATASRSNGSSASASGNSEPGSSWRDIRTRRWQQRALDSGHKPVRDRSRPSFFVLSCGQPGRRDILPPDRVRRGRLSDSSAGIIITKCLEETLETLHFQKKCSLLGRH